jgi:MFS transporter, DHA2 family, methylenomycin A resistance protein
MMIVSSISGSLAHRYGARPMILGYALIGVSMLWMGTFSPSTSYAVIAPLFALLGVGLGLAVPSTSAAAMMAAPRERSGAASATVNALRQAGMTLGIAMLGAIMGGRATTSLAVALSSRGISKASEWAGLAVSRHQPPPDLGLAPDVFRSLLARAFADGFSAAVIGAGGLGVAASLILLRTTRQRRLLAATPAPKREAIAEEGP